MGAPRRWTDFQRAAIWRMAEQGLGATEIARRCSRGTASVSPFQIPRRTVADILSRMARERGQEDLPRRLEDVIDADSEDLIERYPTIVLGLVEADSERLKRKQSLSLDDYNRLRAGVGIAAQIGRLRNGRGSASNAQHRQGSHATWRTGRRVIPGQDGARDQRGASG